MCAFNLGADALEVALPPELAIEPLQGHGQLGTLDGAIVRLPRYGAFFGRGGASDARAGAD